MLGFCLYKASFIFGYVGNLTDGAPQVGVESDPETVQTLNSALLTQVTAQ